MPLPLLLAGIAAGSQLLGQGINAASTAKNNRQSRYHAKEMYSWQRRDALADYQMQNEYNSPVAQMQRLRDAKLNPNLVYGNGTETTASPIRPAAAPSAPTEAPQFDLGSAAHAGISTYADLRLKEAQTNLLQEQATSTIKTRELTNIQTAIGIAKEAAMWNDVRQKEFDLSQKYGLRQESQDIVRESLRKLKADIYQTGVNTTYTQNQDKRADSMNTATLAEITARIASMGFQNAKTSVETQQTQITMDNLQKSGVLQDLEIEMRKKGMTFNDPAWQRQISEAWNNPKKLIPTIKNFINRLKSSKN